MNGRVPRRGTGAEEHRLLDEVRQLWTEADPVPRTLADRIRFAVRLANLDAELTSMTGRLEVASVRGDDTTRVLTFEWDGGTLLVNVTKGDGGTVRVDGWLSPPACHDVELLTTAGLRTARCDCDGRFAIADVQAGMARLAVRPSGDRRKVKTPVIDL